jgi:hypothetical protein
MGSGHTHARAFAFIRRRHKTAQRKRSLGDWIALTIARGLTSAVVGGLVYVTYVIQVASYNDFRRCNPSSTITRIEWALGFRPAEDCRRY